MGQITRDRWVNDYIGAFNRGDFASFTSFYDDNVTLNLSGKRQLIGKQAIIDFYTNVFERIKETLTVEKVVVDEAGLAGIVSTEFHALADWPDFIAGPILKGESIFIESFVVYTIRDGKFTEIRSARSKDPVKGPPKSV
ncbi:MAG: nuclear transport factor 2 family protein [Hyphomonadaceae bacterium]|nr:nuclear transport factor 2 family protein [Hyphomonadaceae bacterium]